MSVKIVLQRSIINTAALMQFFKDLIDRLSRKPIKRTSKKRKINSQEKQEKLLSKKVPNINSYENFGFLMTKKKESKR